MLSISSFPPKHPEVVERSKGNEKVRNSMFHASGKKSNLLNILISTYALYHFVEMTKDTPHGVVLGLYQPFRQGLPIDSIHLSR
tara:strand:- start:2214 stop:2465 length:252 start_codon:yes stop_codon:yes gene_type:complete